MQERPIVLTWGVGPSYRKRAIKNVEYAVKSGYDNIMDYIILTDVPEDFFNLQDKTKKIIDIVDIHKEREKYPWAIEQEYIPTNQETYGDDFREALRYGKMFSHCSDRFSIKRACELGYTKLVQHDPDLIFYYSWLVKGKITEEFFWSHFDTKENTIKGSCLEKIEINIDETFKHSRAIGHTSIHTLQYITYLLCKLNEVYNSKFPIMHNNFSLTESALKYFHFNSSETGLKYFDVLNNLAKISYSKEPSNPIWAHGGAGAMLCDFIPYGLAHLYNGLEVLDFPMGSEQICSGYVFADDRYFLPPDSRFQITKNSQEFLEVNKDEIEDFKKRYQWPILNVDPYSIENLIEQ